MQKGFIYDVQIRGNLDDLIRDIEKTKGVMKGLFESGNDQGIKSSFDKIEKYIERLREKTAKPIETLGMFDSIQRDADKISIEFEKVEAAIVKLNEKTRSEKIQLLPEDQRTKLEAAENALQSFQKAIEQAGQKSKALVTAEQQLIKVQTKLSILSDDSNKAKKQIELTEQEIQDIDKKKQAVLNLVAALEKQKAVQTGSKKEKQEAASELSTAKSQTAELGIGSNLNLDQAKQALQKFDDELNQGLNNLEKYEAALQASEQEINDLSASEEKLSSTVDKLTAEQQQGITKTQNVAVAFQKLQNQAAALGISLDGIDTPQTQEDFKKLEDTINSFIDNGLSNLNSNLQEGKTKVQDMGNSVDAMETQMDSAGHAVEELDSKVKNGQAFAQRISQFVGLEGAMQIARRAMRDAMQTIKELDAQMTEMAVVTDLEIGDYWDQLADHTERASALGLAIKDIYEAETLYYQQGLKSAEVQALANQTLKMGRIAGLSAADATDKMTAALRGFNMELNETSAQRVADVYSKLAAITASDVNEISEAMTKTASIASSAGMEFETTAAFLSQIIETTRESAETAGTAMKTVVARFQELKKDPAEIGEVDGEIVDANQIETALRSVGVALRDTNGQFRNLDDVFLELASKWDGLDTNTQRYIATIAAGSRQQSRFIAMMQDYGRTQELVSAANNSAGASNEQFEKTLDSLETKLNELKNAWDTFVMGIMDSEFLKSAISVLTAMLSVLNKIVEMFDTVGLGGVASIGMIVAALYLGAKAIDVFGISLKKSGSIFKAFGAVGKSSVQGINKIFAKLNKTITKVTGKPIKIDTKSATVSAKQYAKAQQDISKQVVARQKIESSGDMDLAGKKAALLAIDEKKIAAEKRKTKAVTEYALATGLTNAQAEASMAIQGLGISMDLAEKIAKEGLTKENEELLATELSKITTDTAEIGVTTTKVGAILAETGAEKVENKTRKSGIALLFGKIGAIAVNIGMLIAQTTAQWAANIAEYAGCPPTLALAAAILVMAAAILLAIGFLVLIVVAIIKMINNSKKAEEELKSAEGASKAAAEAAEAAAEAYNNLADAFDTLNDKYNALEELTEGTKEWNEAIKEINEQVLDLIEKYPELAAFVDGSEGYLKLDIESDEVQNVLNEYEKKSAAATAASYAAKINVNEKKSIVRSQEVREKAYQNYWNNGYSGTISISDETNKKLAKAMSSGELVEKDGDGSMVNEITDWLKENGTSYYDSVSGYTYDETTYASSLALYLNEATEELRDFGQELEAMAEQERVYNQAMADAAYQAADLSAFSAKQQQQMQNAATAEFSDQMNKKNQEEYQKMVDEKDSAGIDEAKEQVAKNLYGEDATVSGNKITYYDESGEKQTKELTDEEFKEQWAAIKATEEMTAALEAVPGRIVKVTQQLDKFSEGLGDAYRQIMSDSSKTTKKQASIAKSGIANGEFEKQMLDTWSTLSSQEKAYYDNDIDKFIDEFTTASERLSKEFDGAEAKLQKYSTALTTINDEFTAENATAYADSMALLATGLNGEEGKKKIEEINGYINNIASSLPTEKFNTFISQLNAIDKQDLGAWEEFEETLKSLNLGNVLSTDAYKNFASAAQEAAGAIRKIDLEEFAKNLRNMQKIVGDIQSGEVTRNIDADLYNEITKNNKNLMKDFVLNNDGTYTYLGNNMQLLASAISENTEVQRNKNIGQIKDVLLAQDAAEKLANYNFTNENGEFGDSMDIQNASDWDSAQQRNYIASIVQTMRDNGADVSSLEITGLTNGTTIESLNNAFDADIDTIFSELISKLTDSSYEDKLREQEQLQQSAMFNQNSDINAQLLQSSLVNATNNQKVSDQWVEDVFSRSQVLLAQAIDSGVNESAIGAYSDKISKLYEILNAEYASDEERFKALSEMDLGNATDALMQAVEQAKKLNEETEEWVSQFDYLDQLTRKTTQTQKEREKLERKYTSLIENETLDQEAILEIMLQQAQVLNRSANLSVQKWAESAGALAQMTSRDASNQNAAFAEFTNYNADTGELYIDYEGANQKFGDNSELGEMFDEYVSQLYEIQDVANEAQEELEDIEDEMKELQTRGEDEYSQLWNDIREVLTNNAQENLDKLSELYDSIENASSQLVDSMQQLIDESRQSRENEKTEQDLSDKESRLAYLMRDTSGRNALEIASLQKEIAESKEDYTDTLIDQSLQRLSDSNEKAAEQRNRQIELAQAQLDAYINSQQSWVDAQLILNQALGSEGALSLELLNLGLGMDMLMGPDGSIATTLTSLLLGNEDQNAIDNANAQQELLNNMEMATAYGVMNGLLTNMGTQITTDTTANVSSLNDLGSLVSQEFMSYKTKAELLNNATNGSINTARENIVLGLTENGEKLDVDGELNQSIVGLLPPKEEKKMWDTFSSGKATTDVKTYLESSTAYKDNELFKDYGEKMKALVDAEEYNQKSSQLANYQNLINDTTGSALTKDKFQELQNNGVIPKDKTYDDYAKARQKNVDNKKTSSSSSTTASSVSTVGGGKPNNPQTITEKKWSATTYNTKYHDATFYVGEVLDTSDIANGYNDSAYLDINGTKEWVTTVGKSSSGSDSEVNTFVRTNKINDYILFTYDKGDGTGKKYYLALGGVGYQIDPDSLETGLLTSNAVLKKYEAGGLADFTGPAWLDGTKSKPEMVLNQRDTANFIVLKDILSEILSGTSSISKEKSDKNGDNYFDIDISVDSIGEDYDVEQLADKIRSMIYEDASYRNVNTINSIR